MYETLHCVALRRIKYSDSRSILTAWSAERGYVSLAMPAGNGRESTRRMALTMPLATFEGVCDVRPGRDILFMRDMRPSGVGIAVEGNPAKLATALFLSEVFEKLLRNAGSDEALSRMVFDTVASLVRAGRRGTANFAVWTLYRLTVPLGIEPDMSGSRDGAIFDMEAARWRMSFPSSATMCLQGDEARAAMIVSRLTRDNIERLRLTRPVRRQMLDCLLKYYDMHYCRLTPLNSLEVVSGLF